MYKIYKLVDNTNGNTYYGRTIQTLSKRLHGHKFKPNSSKCIIDNGDYHIELIEETDDKSRERYYIENNPCVNKEVPCRTIKEYLDANRDEWRKYDREWKDKRRSWERSWGGDLRLNNNCLLRIDPKIFS